MLINRRSLFGAAAVAVGSLISGREVFASQTDQKQWDIVVVGAGGAGLSAAVHAANSGLSVLVLEKTSAVGGSTLMSSGQWAVAGSHFQRDLGIEDTRELFIQDMLNFGKRMNDPSLVQAFVDASKIEYEWILAHGVSPRYLIANAGMSVPRAHFFEPKEVLDLYTRQLTRMNVPIRFNSPAHRLFFDPKNKRINGVYVTYNNKKALVRARLGVILATGGFARNKNLLKKYAPACSEAFVLCGKGSTGDGMIMAQEFGADLLDMAYIQPTYGYLPHPESSRDKTSAFYAGGIIVNRAGRRFINESLSYKTIGALALQQPEGRTYIVFDDLIRRQALTKDPRERQYIGEQGKAHRGFVAASIRELAAKAGINADVLQQTVSLYNETAPFGKDILGRQTLTYTYGKPLPITEPPFVAIEASAALLTTYCGLHVNPLMNVVNVFGEEIHGLYAAGEVTGGVHGASSVSGTGFAKAFAMGRIAVEALKAQI